MTRATGKLDHRILRNSLIVTGLLAMAAVAWAAGGKGQNSAGADHVDQLLSRMTLPEKITLLHGSPENPATYQGQAGYIAGIPRLGIPGLRMADGPPGVLTRHRSTALTATMGLAATFSPQDARLDGEVIGRDARALGINVALQPFINIFRDPTWTRAYNTYGEDPLLTGEIGAGLVRGIQSQGVMSQAKHFIGYDGANNVIVGQQALHEIYAEPFAYVVRAGVSSVMCSYNKINGAWSCGNSQNLKKLLKGEMKFKGFVTSDWGATHSSDFVMKGTDMQMPGDVGAISSMMPCYFCANVPKSRGSSGRRAGAGLFYASHIPEEPASTRRPGGIGFSHPAPTQGLMAAIRSGEVSKAAVTEAARRILTEYQRFGLLSGKSKHNVTPVPFNADRKVVEKTAEDAAVLLKNDGNALPLTTSDLQSLAVIGPGAGQTITIGESGEKALGFPSRDLGPLEALKAATQSVPNRHISFAVADNMTGHPVPAAILSHDGKPGLLHENAKGQSVGVDSQLNFTVKNGHALPAGSNNSWHGVLNVPKSGDYWIYLQLLGCSGQLKIDGKLLSRSSSLFLHGNVLQPGQDNVLPTTDNLDNVRAAIQLSAGAHALEVDEQADPSGKPVQIRLNWYTPEQRQADFQAAVNAARHAKTAVVFAWGRGKPAFQLPGNQNQLIEQIARVNPRTIVVLNTSQPDDLPWLGQVKAVLEMWYPGDGGGVATANVLLGRTDPGGRLPFTWAHRLDQYVSHDPKYPERSSQGVNGVTHYSEGIFVGYRWFDHQDIQPLFPFGYGLSYTQFRYSGLRVTRAADGGLTVNFAVHNTGHVFGDEVPQVYLGPPATAPAGAQFAVKALAGFDRIGIPAGQSREVSIHVPLRQLQYWSDAASNWKLAAGARTVYVGASSRDMRLQQAITIRP